MRSGRAVRTRGLVLLLCALLGTGLGCAGPVVVQRLVERNTNALQRIAVAPFLIARTFRQSSNPGSPSGPVAASLVARFVAEAFAKQGFEVIPASDLQLGFEGQGLIAPRGEPAILAGTAATEFGATAILTGSVLRYAERDGGELGAKRPAGVGFEVTLHSAPDARRLWIGRFDHIQQSLTAAPLEARRYPGRGSRWLSAAQLAQWGADHMAAAIAEWR